MRGNLFSDDIEESFEDLDIIIKEAIYSGELPEGQIELIVAGSAPLIYNNWIPFGTDDIDYISCTSQWLTQFFPEYSINSRIHAYGDSWTYNYEDRLELLYQGKYLVVYNMSLEDLLFMKLTRWSDNDIRDIEALINNGIVIDFDFLHFLIYDEEEARGAGMSQRSYDELLYAYEELLLRIEQDDWDPKHHPRQA